MFAQNPKKEFVINYDIESVRAAVLRLNLAEPKYYLLVKDDKVLNEIRLLQKGGTFDVGFHIDFTFSKVADNETKVVVEVSRNMGTINTSSEVSIANNSLKTVTSKFSSFLSGDVNPTTGQANVPPPQGCMVIAVIILTGVSAAIMVLKYWLLT